MPIFKPSLLGNHKGKPGVEYHVPMPHILAMLDSEIPLKGNKQIASNTLSHGFQWIGLVGKIETGNQRFSHEIWDFPVKNHRFSHEIWGFPVKNHRFSHEIWGFPVKNHRFSHEIWGFPVNIFP